MQRPAQAVELPDDQHITGLESLEALRQLWPLHMRPGCLISEYRFAPCPLQRGQLPVRVLIIRRDATIADFHALILALIYNTHNPLFLQRQTSVPEILSFGI